MDWQDRLSRALQWLEDHLTAEIYIEQAAREANCSVFHFARMFQVITGIGPAEYIRRRRLSCAALDLTSGDDRIVDIALRYGYDSPDAFARAFKREFSCLPSDARRPGTALHTYAPLTFSIALKGDKAMEYRIEQRSVIPLTGLTMRTNSQNGDNFAEVPAFWDTLFTDGRFHMLMEKSKDSELKVVGVCHDFDMKTGEFSYTIAVETPKSREGLPDGCEDISVPASTWARFTSRGPLRENFQNTIKRIYSEWFPASGREHAGTAELEYYGSHPDPTAQDYWCEYWVPLK